jgi:hypothetical protein
VQPDLDRLRSKPTVPRNPVFTAVYKQPQRELISIQDERTTLAVADEIAVGSTAVLQNASSNNVRMAIWVQE